MTALEDELIMFFRGVGPFASFGVEAMRRDYHWRLPVRLTEKYGVEATGSCYQATTALKQGFAQRWRRLVKEEAPSDEFVALARDVLAWGGINTCLDKTLRQFCEEALRCPSKGYPLRGIASRSKILSISNPDQYAIMDARVVAALNAISLKVLPELPLPFPYLPSRNRRLKHLGRTGCAKIGAEYSRYLSLLHAASRRLEEEGVPHTLADLEMTLFLAGPVLTECWNQ